VKEEENECILQLLSSFTYMDTLGDKEAAFACSVDFLDSSKKPHEFLLKSP